MTTALYQAAPCPECHGAKERRYPTDQEGGIETCQHCDGSGVDPEVAPLLHYMSRLAEIENDTDHQRVVLRIGPYTALLTIGALQAATRHPENTPRMTAALIDVIEQLTPLFAGTSGAEIIHRGNNPSNDL